MASAATNLLNDMVEQIIYGDGASAAAEFALDASAPVKASASEQAQVRLYSGSLDADEKAAHKQAITLLTTPPAVLVNQAASGGMSNEVKIALVGGGLFAAWYFFIRK